MEKESSSQISELIEVINPLLLPVGYEVVHLEIQMQRQRTLRVFIDFSEPAEGKTVGIEDCVKATRALDEPLDQVEKIQALFKGTYELEVSSPGVDRPLRLEKDYSRFAGKEARIHTYRALTANELGNTSYFEKNPRQKNFLGILSGIKDGKVLLAVSAGSSAKQGKSKQKPKTNKDRDPAASAEISIPLPLISKANLEPQFDFGADS